MDSTFVGIDYNTWRFINSFAPWLAAFATLTAVLVALYLARKDKFIKLRITTEVSLIQGGGRYAGLPQYISIIIVNQNIRRAIIQYYGFYVKSETYQIIPLDDGISSTCPITLNDGESARYMLENKDFLEAADKLNKGKLKGLKVYVKTSSGELFTNKLSKSVVNILKSEKVK